jgi:hypothetical protein
LNAREMTILIPIALCVIILGVYPNMVLKTIEQPAMALTQIAPAPPVIERRLARTSPAGQRPAPSPRQSSRQPTTRTAR